MEQSPIRLEDFLSEVAYGEVRLTVVDKKIFQVPKQRIERPLKHGVRVEMIIDEPIRLSV